MGATYCIVRSSDVFYWYEAFSRQTFRFRYVELSTRSYADFHPTFRSHQPQELLHHDVVIFLLSPLHSVDPHSLHTLLCGQSRQPVHAHILNENEEVRVGFRVQYSYYYVASISRIALGSWQAPQSS